MSAAPSTPIPVVATPAFPPSLNFAQVISVSLAIGQFLDQVALLIAPAFPAEAPEIQSVVALNAPFVAALIAANAATPPTSLVATVGNFNTAAQAVVPASVRLPIPLSNIIAAVQGFGTLANSIQAAIKGTPAPPKSA